MSYWQQYPPPPPVVHPQAASVPPPSTGTWPANFQPSQPSYNYAAPFQQQPSPFCAIQPNTFSQASHQGPPPALLPWSQPLPMSPQNIQPSGWPGALWGQSTQQNAPHKQTPCSSKPPDNTGPDEGKENALLQIVPDWMKEKIKRHEEEKSANVVQTVSTATKTVDVLRDALLAVDNLKELRGRAKLCISSDDAQWTLLMKEIKSSQETVKALCEELSKENVLADLKGYARKQNKKRERCRRQVAQRKREKEEAEEHAAQQEARINAYRQRILDKALQEKQEAEMREEVDSVLSEIRFKISRTREYLEKLSALEQLRDARKDSYRRKGLYVAPEADERFTTEMASVRSLLESQLVSYQKEETALKVMLESEQKEQYQTKKIQLKQDTILECLFGSQDVDHILYPFYTYFCSPMTSIEAFMSNREAWDRCIVPQSYPQGESVPVQWVKPEQPSSQMWAEYCSH
ncbi:programmed cell death protein 7-like isoform X2 [Ornithodoros turicata]|uniref:programmed cell death protein 7-like isoform X2 n=1 Tax=Ornithodoros turicata TaxID=34597 RepID=UPI00313962FF